MNPFRLPASTFAAIVLLWPLAASAQLPTGRLNTVFPPGGQQGKTLSVKVLSSADLDESSVIWFSHPGIVGEPSSSSTEGSSEFQVRIDPAVPPGCYEVRVGGIFGLSNPRRFQVGRYQESVESEPNNRREESNELSVNATVNGRVESRGDVDWFKFNARAGQRVLAACAAQQTDSVLQAVVELFDSSGRRLAASGGSRTPDPIADVIIPADGAYYVRVFDHAYRGSVDHIYRLTVHDGAHVDYVFPPAVVPGTQQEVTVFGRNLPGGTDSGLTRDGSVLEKLVTSITAPTDRNPLVASSLITSDRSDIDGFDWRLGEAEPVLVQYADLPPTTEAEPNDEVAEAQQISVPAEVAARFQQAGDTDRFVFNAQKGEVFTIEVFGQRTNGTTDPWFTVESVQVSADNKVATKRITSQDDSSANVGGNDFLTSGSDPRFRFQAPADGAYQVRVRDRIGDSRGDSSLLYRLVIRRPAPDFRLVALGAKPAPAANQPLEQGSICVRRGGHAEITVLALRRDGFTGPITVTAEGLPTGVSATPVVLGNNQTRTTLVLSAAEAARPGHQPLQIVGRGFIGEATVTRVARSATLVRKQPSTAAHSRLSQSLMLSVLRGSASLQATTAQTEFTVNQSRQLLIPIKLAKRAGFDQNVNVTFTGQPGKIDVENKAIPKGQSEGSFRLYFRPDAPVGSFTLVPRAQAPVSFVRNPWKLERQKSAHAVVVGQLAETTKQRDAAVAAVMSRKKAVADLQSLAAKAPERVKQLTEKGEMAAKAVQAAEAQQKQLTAQREPVMQSRSARQTALEILTRTAAAAPGDKDLAERKQAAAALVAAADKQLAAIDTRIAAATSAVQAAKTQRAAAMKEKANAEAAVREYPGQIAAAMQQITQAEATLAQMEEKLKAAQAAKNEADKQLKAVQDQTKPASVNVYDPVTPIVVHVRKAPLTLSPTVPAEGQLKRGQSIELSVKINRSTHRGPLRLSLFVPSARPGITSAAVDVAAETGDAKLTVAASAEATEGALANAVVRATFSHSGEEYVVDAPVKVQVVK